MIQFRRALQFCCVVFIVIVLIPGCAKKEEEQTFEAFVKEYLPDTLSFTAKIQRSIPHTHQKLQTFAQNHPDKEFFAAVNLNQFVSRSDLFDLFGDKELEIINLYYGSGVFSGIYPVDPALEMDSTIALLTLEATTQLEDNIRLGTEETAKIADEIQRKAVEEELGRMSKSLEAIRDEGILFYGAEVRGHPGDLLELLNNPKQLVRVVFPQEPKEGSWVRLSPYQYDRLAEKERQTALQ